MAEEDINKKLHHDTKVAVKGWWNENDDIEAKKLRRAKHRKDNINFNKKNKIIINKGENKRFYTEPTMSWGELVSKNTNYDNDGDQMIDENDSSDDAFANVDPKNTNFDYDEIDDIKDNKMEIEQNVSNNNNNNNNEDIECDKNEETEQNEEFELWNIEQFENDIEQNISDENENKNENKFDVFDDNGNCILELNDNDTMFYRNENNEDEMWEYWMELKKEFRTHVRRHKIWAEKKQQKQQFDNLMDNAITDQQKDNNFDTQKYNNRPKKRRRVNE
eukprot:502632_1